MSKQTPTRYEIERRALNLPCPDCSPGPDKRCLNRRGAVVRPAHASRMRAAVAELAAPPDAFGAFLQGVVADCVEGVPALPKLADGEAMRLFDLGFDRASDMSTQPEPNPYLSVDDVVIDCLERGGFELLVDEVSVRPRVGAATVCPRAAEVSAGAQAYLVKWSRFEREAWAPKHDRTELVVLAPPTDEETSAATLRAVRVLADEFDVEVGDVLNDGALLSVARELGRAFLLTRQARQRADYRADLRERFDDDLDDLVAYLNDRDVFALPKMIGVAKWCIGSDPSGAIYLQRLADYRKPGPWATASRLPNLGPTVWATPGWNDGPELPLQLDVAGIEGFTIEREVLVPWTGDPATDQALYRAAVRTLLDELDAAAGGAA